MTAEFKMALLELLRKYQGEPEVDALREGLRWLAQQLMELEVRERIGAQRYERTETRKTSRNGYRSRPWDTRVGTIELRIPKLRQGSDFPSLLEPRRRAERALVAVVQEAYVQGVSTRKVDDLVRALGLDGISKSEVSRLCAELDEQMERFRNRPLEGEYPYLWLDAKPIKVRQDHRVVNMAAVIAVGVTRTGQLEVLGFDVGAAETYEFWLAFLRSLVARGLKGVRLVISDAHEGLKRAISEVLAGASWQRCRVHFMRNLLARVPKHAQPMVAALVRTIFAQPDLASAREQLEHVAANLDQRFPQAAALLRDAVEDVLAYMAFPAEHWRRIHSTNVLERLNRELARRCNVVGICPNVAAVLRLLGALLEEQQDEWLVSRRYFSLESMAKIDANPPREGSQRSGDRTALKALAV
ncbi:IS256-like element ISTsu1 family transposase [Thermaerobacter subterraneus]|uniref:Mutator family transposase n=1 Tax=Thermaerobacter subterraneus DSM 13965 TaxID=867903 RepID=K6Q1U8_9FIRM|nr:IS256-like element ISTsu1 family transposase [Thermaerobacter subterraneus]EKP95148.1 transposase [Thermaerobacter subterraneus DSM 13965]